MSDKIPLGYCQCGCGQKTKICTHTDKRIKNHILGRPKDFVVGHAIRGPRNPSYKGNKRFSKEGYVMVLSPYHPNKNSHGQVAEHTLVCEKELGRYLLPNEVVHHIDKNKSNNTPSNLIVFKNNTEHLLFHQKQRAYDASGHYDWMMCRYCKKYDDPNNLKVRTYNNHTYAEHIACNREYQRKRKLIKKQERDYLKIC